MRRILPVLAALATAAALSIPAAAAEPTTTASDHAAAQQYCFNVTDGPESNPNVTGRRASTPS